MSQIHNQRDDDPVLKDAALTLRRDWLRARHASLLLCRVQQRLESRMMVNPGIWGLTSELLSGVDSVAKAQDAYAIAREAEVFAMTDVLKRQDAIPNVRATSLAGIVAKLEMIVGADRDIDDAADFPWPHIASVLRDLQSIEGELPNARPDRATTRLELVRHWECAAKLVAAVNDEDAGVSSAAS